MVAVPKPQELRIKHVTAIKPLLKPDDRRQHVFAEAAALSARSGGEGAPVAVPDIVRALALAADPPKRSGSPKKSGMAQVVSSETGKAVLRIEGTDRKGIRLTLRSEEHTSELQSLMRISYAVFCLKKKNHNNNNEEHIRDTDA